MDLAAEVERLRTLLDRVPACLLRVSHDGKLLAVSDAALSLLGARELADVLDANIVERLDAASIGALWADFVDRVEQNGSASFECDMIEAGGNPRAVMLLGARLPHHPDAVPSLFVAVRDVSNARRLESSLHQQQEVQDSVIDGLENATASLQELRVQLSEANAQRKEMEQALAAEAVQRQHLAAAVDQLSHALAAAVSAAAQVRHALEKEPVRS